MTSPGLLETTIGVMRRPNTFFGGTPGRWSDVHPAVYAVIVTGVPLCVALAIVGEGRDAPDYVLLFFAVGFASLVSAGLATLCAHTFVRAAGGAPRSLAETFSCVCYCQAPMVLLVVPLLGCALAPLWSCVALTIGLRRLHGVSTAIAVGAAVVAQGAEVGLAVGLWYGSV